MNAFRLELVDRESLVGGELLFLRKHGPEQATPELASGSPEKTIGRLRIFLRERRPTAKNRALEASFLVFLYATCF